jgi:AhpD family alkylhydroperoxidase
MKERLDFKKASPGAYKTMAAVENYVRQSGVDHALLELVKTRVSQINGCAYCLDMHTKDARAHGESEQRLFVLSQWRETSFYSDKERAALAWAEAVTRISADAVSDELFAEARRHFDEKSLVDLTLAIIAINGWNRLALPFRSEPGSYRPEIAAKER